VLVMVYLCCPFCEGLPATIIVFSLKRLGLFPFPVSCLISFGIFSQTLHDFPVSCVTLCNVQLSVPSCSAQSYSVYVLYFREDQCLTQTAFWFGCGTVKVVVPPTPLGGCVTVSLSRHCQKEY